MWFARETVKVVRKCCTSNGFEAAFNFLNFIVLLGRETGIEDLRKAPGPISDFYLHFFFIVFELKKLVPLICQIDRFFEENICQAADRLLTVGVLSAYRTATRTTFRRTLVLVLQCGVGAREPFSLPSNQV